MVEDTYLVWRASHKHRFHILKAVSEKETLLTDIENAVGKDMSYHLKELINDGLVTASYTISKEESSRGRSKRIIQITDKGKVVLEQLRRLIEVLK